jgi:hypothetical protein
MAHAPLPQLGLEVLLQALVLYLLSRTIYEWVVQSVVARKPRGGWVLQALRLPGNAVHEVSHALGYLVFGYRVKRLELSIWDPAGRGVCQPGKAWSPVSLPWLATGAAAVLPLVAGAATLSLCAMALGFAFHSGHSDPGEWAVLQAWDTLRETYRALNFHQWQTWVFLYLALSIGAELAPSDTDIRRGLGPVLLAGLGVALSAAVLGHLRPDSPAWHGLSHALAAGLSQLSWVLGFGIMANLLALALSLPGALIVRAFRNLPLALALARRRAGRRRH